MQQVSKEGRLGDIIETSFIRRSPNLGKNTPGTEKSVELATLNNTMDPNALGVTSSTNTSSSDLSSNDILHIDEPLNPEKIPPALQNCIRVKDLTATWERRNEQEEVDEEKKVLKKVSFEVCQVKTLANYSIWNIITCI